MARTSRTQCIVVVPVRALSHARNISLPPPRLAYLRMCALRRQCAHLLRHVLPVHLLSPSLQQLQIQLLSARAILGPRGFQQRLSVLVRRQAQIAAVETLGVVDIIKRVRVRERGRKARAQRGLVRVGGHVPHEKHAARRVRPLLLWRFRSWGGRRCTLRLFMRALRAFDFVGRGYGGGGGTGCDAVEEVLAVLGILGLKRVPALFGERAEARLARLQLLDGRDAVVVGGTPRAVLLVGEAGEDVRGDVGLVERDERKAFTSGDGVWGVFVVRGKENVLDGAGGVQEGAQ